MSRKPPEATSQGGNMLQGETGHGCRPSFLRQLRPIIRHGDMRTQNLESHSLSLHATEHRKRKAETAHLATTIQRPPRTRTRTSGAASYRFSSHGHSGWWGGLINRLEHVQRPGSLGSCCHFALGARNRRGAVNLEQFGQGSATNSKQRSTCQCGDVSGLRLMWVCIPEYSANRHFPSDEPLRQVEVEVESVHFVHATPARLMGRISRST